MTPPRRALDKIEPLSLDNKIGNGSPAPEDLIKVQAAILSSNASVLGAVTEFRRSVDQRLTRQFGEVTTQIGTVSGTLDGVVEEVRTIKNERREEAIRAEERTGAARQANVIAVAADGVAVQHSLSKNQRMAVMVSAASAATAALLGFLNFVAGK